MSNEGVIAYFFPSRELRELDGKGEELSSSLPVIRLLSFKSTSPKLSCFPNFIMIKSHHLYPFFPDLIENQRRSVQSFWEKGMLEEFELFSYILGKKKNLQMILHGSNFMLQRPKYNLEEAVRKQKSYSVSLFLPIEFQWYENNKKQMGGRGGGTTSAPPAAAVDSISVAPTTSRILSIRTEENLVQKDEILELGEAERTLETRSFSGRSPRSPRQTFAREAVNSFDESNLFSEVSSSQIFPVFLGDIPLMTERGSFLINGSARVLVNQIVRCPSVYFKVKVDHKNRRTYIASFLSDYGSWLRLETDYKSRIWVRIDKSQRVSIYALLRSLGFPESFLKYQLKYYSFLFASRESYYTDQPNEAVQYLWKKLTPGRWNSIQGCYSFLYNKFFNPRRYSIGPVGRIRLNKRLNRKREAETFGDGNRKLNFQNSSSVSFDLRNHWDDDFLRKASPDSERLSSAQKFSALSEQKSSLRVLSLPTLTPEDIFMALDLLIQFHYGEGSLDDIDHLKNRRVRLPGELIQNQFRLALSRITQIATEKITKFEVEKDLRDRRASSEKVFQQNMSPLGDFHREGSEVRGGQNEVAPSLGKANSPIFGTGTVASSAGLRPTLLKNFFQAQLFGSSVRELFHTSQLSQYMDQTNPLAEITHKRRLSSLGPGGIGRDQAGFAVREIHPSHFGRICPIETPEGPNAGLVGSLASYSRITENGFLQSPYFVSSGKKEFKPHFDANGLTSESSEWFLFSSEVEDESYICSESEFTGSEVVHSERKYGEGEFLEPHLSVDGRGSPLQKQVLVPAVSLLKNDPGTKLYPTRFKQEFLRVEKNQIQFFSISPIQMISLATSLIPFLEHDDANRALMGSNMQRQAVPILFAEKPLVGTGLELQAARDSSTTLLVKQTGQVIYVDSAQIIIESKEQQQKTLKTHDSLTIHERKRGGGNTELSAKSLPSRKASGGLAEPSLGADKARNQSYSPQATFWGQTGVGRSPGEVYSQSPTNFEAESQGGVEPSTSFMPEIVPNCLNSSDLFIEVYKLQNYWRSNQNTCLRQRPQVKRGEWVEKGDLLADGSATQHGEISLGKNILLAYMPWEGYNFEDAIVINERLVQEDIYTSIHIDRYDIEIRETSYGKEKITNNLPYINSEQTRNLDSTGIIFPGTWVEEGDILVGKITPISPPKPTPEYRLLLAIFETKPLPFKESSLRVPQGVEGRVLDCIIEYQAGRGAGQNLPHDSVSLESDRDALGGRSSLMSDLSSGLVHNPEKVQIFLAHKRKIQLGDKMSGRHGNKGIVSLILPPQDMPFLQDGTPVDIVLNPLGVPSRMNVGQVLECLFGLAGHYLSQHYRLLPFDEMYGKDASRGLVYKKLYEASCRTGYDWLFDPNSPGKTHLFDGRTGEPFHQPVLVGYSYMFKLIHLVDEKMHARSTGPYSLVTQQPLGGRSKHGGQRLGEMEVWALEGFGAASILQEFLTVKSDEIYARNTFLFHLMKRRKLPRPGLPESFRVLVHELQSLCLSVYYNPDFRLTYPSLIGWDGLFLLSSKKFPTLQQLSNLKNI